MERYLILITTSHTEASIAISEKPKVYTDKINEKPTYANTAHIPQPRKCIKFTHRLHQKLPTHRYTILYVALHCYHIATVLWDARR